MLTVHEMITEKEMLQFVKFPFKLYKDNPYWVPPIIKEELASFDKKVNPVFENADARFFVAKRDNEIVGRISVIINHTEINEQKIKKVRFGWFDFIDDLEVSKILLEKVQEIGKVNNLEYMEGPMGFSNMDKVGVLTYGFDHVGTMITWYNYPYYQEHFSQLGFTVEKKYIESKFSFKDVDIAPIQRIGNMVATRYKLKVLNFTKTKEVLPYVDAMFDLFNESYASLPSFVPISEIQKEYFKKKYISFINPEFIKFVVDENNNMIGFAITMVSFSKALQRIKGKLFPFGFIHLLRAQKNSKDIIFYLIGVRPDYQNKGVHATIFTEYYKTFTKYNIETCIRTPELESNKAIAAVWKNFNSIVYKKRCTYKKDL